MPTAEDDALSLFIKRLHLHIFNVFIVDFKGYTLQVGIQ